MLFKNRYQIIENGQTLELKKIREDILDILTSALNAVDPYNVVKSRFEGEKINIDEKVIELSNFENIYLIGFGKASVGMAQAICDMVNVTKGTVVTNDPNNKVQSNRVTTVVGNHPIPNQNSIAGTEKILDVIEECGEKDLLLVMISGGGSALLCKPKVSLKELQQTTDLLLKSGADINEINTIRKHLSFVKGGQLATATKGTILSLIISDIVGDPLEFIASGPTCPDSTTYIDAESILNNYNIWENLPVAVRTVIMDGITSKIPETPKNGDAVFDKVWNCIIANNELACKAAENKAKELGYTTMLLTTSLTGKAKEMSRYLVDRAQNYETDDTKMVFIAGGETTVTIKGNGKGGRNQELVLASVTELDDTEMVFASFATDGIDGTSNAAGAIADGVSMTRARNKNLNPERFLEENNSYAFFKELDDVFMTGSTGTNVMDIQLLIK
jgi:glycerate 2-kinase